MGEVYELTGPRLMTFAQAVEEIAQAAGRPVWCTSIPLNVFTDAMAAQGEPAEVVALLRYLFNDVLDGRNARLADGVQRALGRAPRDFGEFVREVAGRGVWERHSQHSRRRDWRCNLVCGCRSELALGNCCQPFAGNLQARPTDSDKSESVVLDT